MTSALPSTTLSVDPAWIDEYGHMNAAHYVGIFDRVGFQLLREVGVGLDYTEATRCGIYTMNVHVAYLREVLAGDPLALRIRLLEADDKRLLCLMELMQTRDGYVAATMEQLSLHVDLETPSRFRRSWRSGWRAPSRSTPPSRCRRATGGSCR
jgi:acyl-CoA thioester hydrolase